MTFLQGTASRANPSPISLNRSKIRRLLRKGGTGNACAFIQASSYYFDLLSEYFYLLGYTHPQDRLTEIRSTLFDCWRYAPYIRRVSDFERFLEIQLEKRSVNRFLDLPEPHTQLGNLSHLQRFLLVARVYQHWSFRAIQLSTRLRKQEVAQALADFKCELIGFKPQMLKLHQQALITRVSNLMEGELSTRNSRKIEREIVDNYHVLQFKAEWLSYRCELAELKPLMFIEAEQLERFKSRLNDELKELPLEQPSFSDTLINQISFVRIPSN